MCGICGVARIGAPGPVDRDLLASMRDTMIHRGPDDEGLFVDREVGLGHRRLAIIDRSGGSQPMANDDETVWITYNGELYNFRPLRALLESQGHVFRTKSDTEVVLRAYEAFGDAFLERLQGMFAFAIWDGRRKRLLLARDRLGIKPLYYTLHDGMLLFASEIKAILRWPGVPRAVEPRAVREYLRYRYVPGPHTMFRGIFKLQPGHLLVFSEGRTTIRAYWDLPTDGEILSPDEAERSLRERVEACVESHLMSDVPLGVFLSGGLDSTIVTGLMTRMVSEPIQTFAIGYGEDASVNETPFARIAAQRFATMHRELTLDRDRFWAILPRLAWFFDEPVADPAAVPLYFLSRFARQFVTVILSGEGADELLSGYAIHWKMLWLERLRRARIVPPIAPPAFVGRRVRRYLDWARRPLESRYRGVSAVFGAGEVDRLLAADFRSSDANDADSGASYFERTSRLDPLRRMLYYDLKVWLPDDLLVKADKMTMASSLELRVPFLDHHLVEWTWRLPARLKLRGTTGKYLLRKATADLVPREIRRRPKQGFAIPVTDWFRGSLAGSARALLLDAEVSRTLLDRREVEALVTRHDRGEDLSDALFTLAVLACWHRVFIESHGLEPAEPSGSSDA